MSNFFSWDETTINLNYVVSIDWHEDYASVTLVHGEGYDIDGDGYTRFNALILGA